MPRWFTICRLVELSGIQKCGNLVFLVAVAAASLFEIHRLDLSSTTPCHQRLKPKKMRKQIWKIIFCNQFCTDYELLDIPLYVFSRAARLEEQRLSIT